MNPVQGKKQVGNKNTEIIIGSSAAKVLAAIKSLSQATDEINKFQGIIADGTLKVTNLEDQIAGLRQDFDNKRAQQTFDLELAFNTDKQGFTAKFLQDKGMIAVTSMDYQKLQSDLQKATSDVDTQVAAKVNAAIGAITARHAGELKTVGLEYQVKEANNLAAITQLTNEVASLKLSVEDWKSQLTSERSAGVERQKASAIGSLTVGQNGK